MAETSHPLSLFLHPRSIAVIGASSEPRKAGGRRWLSLISEGFAGEIFPVTARASQLSGHRAFRSVRELPTTPDLAIVMVPADSVPGVVRDCAERGVGGVVMVSAGFGETGEAGKTVEAEMVAMLRGSGTRLLGPNSAGVFSASGAVNSVGWSIPRGRIAVITQSGNMALSFTHFARAKSAGLASVMAVGNSADIKIAELVELATADEQTASVLVYCEGFAPGDGRRLIEIAGRRDRRVPIVVLKAGVSEAGRQAAKSHTGSLAGEDTVVSAAFAEAGIIRAREAEEAFDLALALSLCPTPRGSRIAVLSDGGGHATIVADCAGRRGLRLATLGESTRRSLAETLPARSGLDNPIDFAGLAESDPGCTARVLDLCLRDANVDGAIFAGHFGGYHLMTEDAATRDSVATLETAAAAEIGAAAARSGKPVILHSDHAERPLATLAPLREGNIPIYTGLEASAKAMAALAQWGRFKEPGAQPAWLSSPIRMADRNRSGPQALTEEEARRRLAAFGIAIPEYGIAHSPSAALAAFERLGPPVAMKLMSERLVHKSDAGGVVLDIADADQLQTAWGRLSDVSLSLGRSSPTVLVTRMIDKGVECIIGAKWDLHFGPVVLFGAGGIFVELTSDAVIRMAPTSIHEAQAAIGHSLVGKLLRGFRASERLPTNGLAELISAVSRFISQADDVLEVDLNPIIVNAKGAFIADARLVVS